MIIYYIGCLLQKGIGRTRAEYLARWHELRYYFYRICYPGVIKVL
jgi:hypothetical protein